MKIKTLILYYFTFQICKAKEEQDLKTLKLVQIVSRHGDRAPTRTYPTNPHRNISANWPNGLGQLTELGKSQQFKLGQYFRDRYDGYLPSQFNSEEVLVISSDLDRTIQSAEYSLAGLFEDYLNISSNSESMEDIISSVRMAIPLHIVPKMEDNILHYTKPCPRFDEVLLVPRHEGQIDDLTEANRTLVEFVRGKAGHLSNVSFIDIVKVEDVITPEITHNLTMPDWMNISMLLQLRSLRVGIGMSESSTVELKRLKAGPLLRVLLSHMNNKMNGNDQKVKFIMYSAHDSTLVALLDALGVFYPIIPPYSSAIILELHEDPILSNSYWLELYYKNDSSIGPYQLTIPGCSSSCPLDLFVKLTADVTPENWDLECVSSSGKTGSLGRSGFLILGIVGVVLLGICAVTYAVRIKQKKSRLYRERHLSYGSMESVEAGRRVEE